MTSALGESALLEEILVPLMVQNRLPLVPLSAIPLEMGSERISHHQTGWLSARQYPEASGSLRSVISARAGMETQ